MEKIVIVGGVAAGATAAAKARRLSPDAEIIMIEAGADISFANCGLPYYIAGDIDSRSKLILQSPESFNEQYAVNVFTHTQVIAIKRDEHIVQTFNNQTGARLEFEYTKLILAQGGRPIKPNLPGANGNHVFSLWTLDDMDRITDHLDNKEPKSAVVVGGGFIGLEMVEALVKRGLNVSVVEKMPHVMSMMEAETAGFIEREMLEYGVRVVTDNSVDSIGHDYVELGDGRRLVADMVIMSIGVRPTLKLAQEAGLEIGKAGGLLVNEFLQTSDKDIYAAGDMVEIEHRVHNQKVRIPLAGPANRQGRIAAENVLGGKHSYKGSIGTSIVRVFEAVAGITGLSLKQARMAGIDADAVVVHKEHHTAYYPGAETVSAMLVYEKNTGVILGGQTAGYKGADKRLDVIATAAATKMTIQDLADIDFSYSPPIGTANDALNMLAYSAENKMTSYSPSITVGELDYFLQNKEAIVIDVRDVFAYDKSHIQGAIHIPLELLSTKISTLPAMAQILVYDETGKKGHQAVRTLIGAGFTNVMNVSGGHISLQRQALVMGFENIDLTVLPLEEKSIHEDKSADAQNSVEEVVEEVQEQQGPIIIDVRTGGEFMAGAVPGAINISLDDIMQNNFNLGTDFSREIIVYCASGARSAYAQQILMQAGFTQVKNGGGVHSMMAMMR